MRTQIEDLGDLEKQAFRRFYEDGLVDLVLGSMMVGTSLAYAFTEWLDSEVIALGIFFGLAVAVVGVFKFWRTRLLRSRLGSFTPGTERRRKVGVARLFLLGSLILGMVAFGLGVVLQGDAPPPAIEIVLPVVWFANATIVLGVAAHMLDVPRFALYGVLFGLVGPLLIWPDAIWGFRLPPPVAFGIPAAPIIAVGVWKLVRFLGDYPPLRDGEPTTGGPAG